MATRIGKHLEMITSSKRAFKTIQKFGKLGYAVLVAVEQSCHLTDDGNLPNNPSTVNKIAQIIHVDVIKVSEVLEYLKKLEYLRVSEDNKFLYNIRMQKEVAKSREISDKRREAGSTRHPLVLDYKTNQSYKRYVKYVNETFDRKFEGDKKSKRQFNARIKEGKTLDDFILAIDNAKKSEWHQKNNFNHCTPELFTREDKLQYWMNAKIITPQQAKGIDLSNRLSETHG